MTDDPDDEDDAEQELTDAIVENAQGPAQASGDSGSVQQHSLPDQIAAQKFIAAKKATAKAGTWGGVQMIRRIPPGTV